MATATDTRLQAKTISPTLTVNNLEQSVKFFEGLGFGVEERWEENGTLLGVMLRAGEARLGLSQDDWKKGRDRQKGVGMRICRHQAERRSARHPGQAGGSRVGRGAA